MSLYEKIYNVMTESEGLEKDLVVGSGANSYKAVGEKEVLNMLKPLFKKHKLVVFPVDGTITEQNSTFESEYNGKVSMKSRNVTQIKVNFKIVDIESGESEILVGFGNGADSQDKGSGKSFTYAYKTMLSKTFMLFSGEDTDNTHSDDIGKKAPQATTTVANSKAESKPPITDNKATTPSMLENKCHDCDHIITATTKRTVEEIIAGSLKFYKVKLCSKCSSKRYTDKQTPETPKSTDPLVCQVCDMPLSMCCCLPESF